MYGTTYYGGANGGGTVFELSPEGDGTWSESVSYSFGKQGPAVPYAGVIMDATGNLYGTGGGYTYELSQGSSGWAVTNMQALPAPLGGVIRDPTGSLYGTTFYGGGSKNCGGGCGTVYRLHLSLTAAGRRPSRTISQPGVTGHFRATGRSPWTSPAAYTA